MTCFAACNPVQQACTCVHTSNVVASIGLWQLQRHHVVLPLDLAAVGTFLAGYFCSTCCRGATISFSACQNCPRQHLQNGNVLQTCVAEKHSLRQDRCSAVLQTFTQELARRPSELQSLLQGYSQPPPDSPGPLQRLQPVVDKHMGQLVTHWRHKGCDAVEVLHSTLQHMREVCAYVCCAGQVAIPVGCCLSAALFSWTKLGLVLFQVHATPETPGLLYSNNIAQHLSLLVTP